MEVTQTELLALRLKYQAACEAYENCVKTMSHSDSEGRRPSAELLEKEAKALKELSDARRRYSTALTQVLFDTPPPH